MLLWKKEYEVGNRFIDSEHKILVDLANEIINSTYSSVIEFKKHYLELLEYTSLHFANEERIMREIHFIGLNEQHRQHEEIVQQMKKLLVDSKSLESVHSHLVVLLKKWVITHIEQEDRKLREPYLRWRKEKLGLQ